MSMLALTLALAAVSSPVPSRTAVNRPPRVEVAFVLDTTGSMGGLLEGAKRRIWSIARRIGGTAAPGGSPSSDTATSATVRDSVHDLSGDMDEVYQYLSSFSANRAATAPSTSPAL